MKPQSYQKLFIVIILFILPGCLTPKKQLRKTQPSVHHVETCIAPIDPMPMKGNTDRIKKAKRKKVRHGIKVAGGILGGIVGLGIAVLGYLFCTGPML